MLTWIRFLIASHIIHNVGVARFCKGVVKALAGWLVLFSAVTLLDVGISLSTAIGETAPVGPFKSLIAGALFVGTLYWFHQDGQRNDRFFNEYSGGTLFSRYTLKSVAGLVLIAVSFVAEPLLVPFGVALAAWYLWKYDWYGRPHGIIALGSFVGLFTVLKGMSPDGTVGATITMLAATLVSSHYSPDEEGWSRGHPKWIWKFDWKKRMRLPIEPHPNYDGNVVNDVYPDEPDESQQDDSEPTTRSGCGQGRTADSTQAPSSTNAQQDGSRTAAQTRPEQRPEEKQRNPQPNAAPTDTSDTSDMSERHAEGQYSETVSDELEFNWETPPDERFENIGGYDEVKEQLTEDVVLPLRGSNPGFERYGIEPARGVLFYGPPGTGKTMFARALAHELGKPFVELSQADLTSEYINEGAQLVDTVFAEAQALGGVVFIDEAEQLLSERAGRNQHNEDQKVMNTFLSALSRDDRNFVVILTTNRRDLMDDAILRPGRVDREVELGLPDEQARVKILKTKLADIPHDLSLADVEEIAAKTAGWSGAELNSLITNGRRDAAIENAPQLQRSHINLEAVDR